LTPENFPEKGAIGRLETGWRAGLEYAFAPDRSVKLEYLPVDLGHGIQRATSVGGTAPGSTRASFDAAHVGLNYKFDLFAPWRPQSQNTNSPPPDASFANSS